MISKAGAGHVGGSLSIAELMAALYGHIMRYDPKNPKWQARDRIVLSKGHAGPAMYAALGLKGFFDTKAFDTLNQPPTMLPSHTDMNRTPGVDMTTGSLGQGASTAAGLALGCKLRGQDNYTYLILGDGECQEGQVWEAAYFAVTKKLNHLIAFLDHNHMQVDGRIEAQMAQPSFADKFRAFGWNVIDVPEGNSVEAICEAVDAAKKLETELPTLILLHTVKGHGCSFAEHAKNCHSMPVSEALMRETWNELDAQLAAL